MHACTKINSIMKTQISNLANEYNSLATKHSKLQSDYDNLKGKFGKYQKCLDEAIGWRTLLWEPQKLPSNWISHIFFDVMFPQLEKWARNKNNAERYEIAGELTKRAICLYTEPTASFMNAPEKASANDAELALISFGAATMPFYEAFMKWHVLHKHDQGASKLFSAHYYLEKFYNEGLRLK